MDEIMIQEAMDIILDAGDARKCIADAFKSISVADFKQCEEYLSKAKKLIGKAHGRQTEIIQDECAGTNKQHSLLFIHAQDTLMTINSELNICKQMLMICKNYEERLSKLENK